MIIIDLTALSSPIKKAIEKILKHKIKYLKSTSPNHDKPKAPRLLPRLHQLRILSPNHDKANTSSKTKTSKKTHKTLFLLHKQ